jgi:hypothetical protein
MSNVNKIYKKIGNYGIIEVLFTDPFSKLIGKINKNITGKYSAVGFYYQNDGIKIILFNTYNNDQVSWLKGRDDILSILQSKYVSKVSCRKLDPNFSNMFYQLLTEAVNENKFTLMDKNNSYTNLMLNISNPNKLCGQMTGYVIVNKVLLSMVNIKNIDISKISTNMVPSPLLSQPFVIDQVNTELTNQSVITDNNPFDNDIKLFNTDKTFVIKNNVDTSSIYENKNPFIKTTKNPDNIVRNELQSIVDLTKDDITKILSIFADLYISNEHFRNSLYDIWNKECQLVITGNNIADNLLAYFDSKMSDESENTELVNECKKYKNLLSSSKINQIKCSTCGEEDINANVNINSLMSLGYGLKKLIENKEPDTPVDLTAIITDYNQCIKNTNLPQLAITSAISKRINLICTSTIDDLLNDTKCSADSDEANNTKFIVTMLGTNLETLTNQQLYDLLIYLDSLRSSDGTYNNRFIGLQNKITSELSERSFIVDKD